MRKFKKVSSEDKDLSKVQDNIELSISNIIDKVVLDGVLLKDISLVTGSTNKVSHKLGRTPLGYIIVKQNANSIIWDTTSNSRIIELSCSANVKVSIWIF